MRAPQLLRDDMPARPETGETVEPVPRRLKVALLVAKLHSEVEEVARALDDPFEYCDVMETLLELAEECGVSEVDIWNALTNKALARGRLRNGLLWTPKEFVE